MRLVSCRESVENEEVSLLALTETLIASLLFFALYWYNDQLWHIGIAVCLAPFLLLKTSQSSEMSLLIAYHTMKLIRSWIIEPPDDANVVLKYAYGIRAEFFFIVSILGAPAVFLVIKVISTILITVKYPIITISAIPENWHKIVLSTDFGTLPELIPGIEDARYGQDSPLYPYRLSGIIEFVFKKGIDEDLWVGTIFMIIIFVPAAVYRISIKSTALIWSPLLWVVRPIGTTEALEVTIRRILETTFAKIGRVYSTIVLSLILIKIALCIQWVKWNTIYESSELLIALKPYIVPDSIPVWHIASFINAILTVIVVYGLARYISDEQRIGASISLNTSRNFKSAFDWLFAIRNLLSVYTILCAIYITIQVTSGWNWPSLNAKFFPY